ncbi:MAG TPA: hypothetical protein VMV02_03330, partial [Acidimicrobiales bacterium]|nr:hypothetical protein [Acidimicrobiales bacterium]
MKCPASHRLSSALHPMLGALGLESTTKFARAKALRQLLASDSAARRGGFPAAAASRIPTGSTRDGHPGRDDSSRSASTSSTGSSESAQAPAGTARA